MYEIMAAVMCTGKRWCDLAVWSIRGDKVIIIHRDDQLISVMKEKLEYIYNIGKEQPTCHKMYSTMAIAHINVCMQEIT